MVHAPPEPLSGSSNLPGRLFPTCQVSALTPTLQAASPPPTCFPHTPLFPHRLQDLSLPSPFAHFPNVRPPGLKPPAAQGNSPSPVASEGPRPQLPSSPLGGGFPARLTRTRGAAAFRPQGGAGSWAPATAGRGRIGPGGRRGDGRGLSGRRRLRHGCASKGGRGVKRDVGRERGRGNRMSRQQAFRSPFTQPVPRTDSDRLTDSAERRERERARARMRTKSSRTRGGGGRQSRRRAAAQCAGARTVPSRSNREGGVKPTSRRASGGWGGARLWGTGRKRRGQASSHAHHCGPRRWRRRCGVEFFSGVFM